MPCTPPMRAAATSSIAVDAGHGGQDPGRHRPRRHAREGRDARDRARARRAHQRGSRACARCSRATATSFWSCATASAARGLARADMFVSVHADSIADRSISGRLGVRALRPRRFERGGALVLAERENAADLMGGVRLDDKGSLAAVLLDATQSEIIGVSASAAERVVERARERRRSAQGAGAAGRVRGAQVPGHPVHAGRDRLHLQSRGGAAPEERQPAGAPGRGDRQRHTQLLPAEPPRRHPLQAAAARNPGQRRGRRRRRRQRPKAACGRVGAVQPQRFRL